MAGLIIKSPYIKCNGKKDASAYLKYIGTRENVELMPDTRPPTRKQEQLINKLVQDFPNATNSPEYEQYSSQHTKYNASRFISQTVEDNWSALSTMDGYMNYIANRPRVERMGKHGLFSDEDEVDLEAVMTELQNYSGNVWTHIMSLKREDAERLGYNNGAAWRDLIRSRRNDIAAVMNISPDNFRWYAAFHNEGHHPHIHMMAWSADDKQGYLNKEGLHRMKSLLTNDIFQMDMLHLYEEKSQSRDELVEEARKAVSELAGTMSKGLANYPELEELILELSKQLPDKGKKSYGYLPKAQKKLVDEIVDKLENLPTVYSCYEKWMELQHQVNSHYKDEELQRIPLSQQKEFRSIKNAVIRQAENIRMKKSLVRG